MKESFDKHGVRLYNTKSLDTYFSSKLYLEQELVILFHNDEEEADPVFEAIQEITIELRKRNVNKVIFGKINMNYNEPSEDFPVYRYPSLYLIFKSKDGHMMSQIIEAENRK